MHWKQAKYITEKKNRFICTIEFEGEVCECYVPSSAKLEHFIDLSGKDIWISENKSKNARTRFKLQAVEIMDNMIPLNMNSYNELLYEYLCANASTDECNMVKEKKLDDKYRADIVIERGEQRLVYEVKAVVCDNSLALFPLRISERATRQLEYFIANIGNETIFYYCLIVPPYLVEIQLNPKEPIYVNLLKACMAKGLNISFLHPKWEKECFVLEKANYKFIEENNTFRKV